MMFKIWKHIFNHMYQTVSKHVLDCFFLYLENKHVFDFENTRKLLLFKKIFYRNKFWKKIKNSYLTYPKDFHFYNFKTWLKLFLKIFYRRLNMAVLGWIVYTIILLGPLCDLVGTFSFIYFVFLYGFIHTMHNLIKNYM